MPYFRTKAWFLTFALICILFSVYGQSSKYGYGAKNTILSIGVGLSPVYRAEQPLMNKAQMPFLTFLELGKEDCSGSVFAHINFHTQFIQSNYLLKPVFINFSYKYSFSRAYNLSNDNLDLFALAGAGIAYTKVTEKGYPGIVDYDYRIEKTLKPGFNFGLGSGYSFGNLKISAILLYLSSRGEYLVGQFDKQIIYSGSYQGSLALSYSFKFDKNRKNTCPAYR
jgi:hypothetical protein